MYAFYKEMTIRKKHFFILHIKATENYAGSSGIKNDVPDGKEQKLLMDREIYKEIYRNILDNAQRIRKEIISEWGDIIMFGGTMPDDVMNDLSIAARITGLSFDALSARGIHYKTAPGKPDLYSIDIDGDGFICHKSAIPSLSGFLDVVNIAGVSQPSAPYSVEEPQKAAPETEKVSVSSAESAGNNFTDADDDKDNIQPMSESDSDPEEEQDPGIFIQGEEIMPQPDEEEDVEENREEESGENDTSVEDMDDSAKEADTAVEEMQKDAEAKTPVIASFTKNDIFTEERTKHRDEFVYEMFEVSLTHSGFSGGGKPSDAIIMVAPLKIQRFTSPSVPIIVAVYCNGKIYTASSYDSAEEGKNLVTLNANEFYLLFRGAYDGNGRFQALVTTTGISASQGDILNVVSEKRYGDDAGRNVNNGHIKFRTTVYDAPGTLEAFPFGDPEDNDFIVMTKTEEFTDYLFISEDSGLKKAIIYQDKQRMQVDCGWDKEDKMYVALKEV